jgi:transposase
MTVMATKADYDRLADDLAAIGRPIVVGFEATGNYHRTLAHRLLAAGFELRLISSVALARTREALHNGWDKNDSKDAQVILHMLQIGATSATSTRWPPASTTCRRCRRRTRPFPRRRRRPGTAS